MLRKGPLPLTRLGASTLPYGASDLGTKWLLRGLFGIANGAASSMANLLNKRFLLSGFSFVLVIATSIVFGVYNPLQSMPEQFVIGFLIAFIPAMSVRIKV